MAKNLNISCIPNGIYFRLIFVAEAAVFVLRFGECLYLNYIYFITLVVSFPLAAPLN